MYYICVNVLNMYECDSLHSGNVLIFYLSKPVLELSFQLLLSDKPRCIVIFFMIIFKTLYLNSAFIQKTLKLQVMCSVIIIIMALQYTCK